MLIGKLEKSYSGVLWIIKDIYNEHIQDDNKIQWHCFKIGLDELNGLRHLAVDTWCQKLWKLTQLERELNKHNEVVSKIEKLMGH